MNRAETGRRGEAAAARWYQKQGCRLLAHNFHTRMGELDVVVQEPDGTIVICEVKTRAEGSLTSPAEAVDRPKQRRLIRAAQYYLQQNGLSDAPVRFDVAEVFPLDSGRWMVHIIRGAFLTYSNGPGGTMYGQRASLPQQKSVLCTFYGEKGATTMQFFSTRDQNRKVTSSEAIAQGLSNEGGLFVPESFPQVDVKALCELDYPAMAAAVIKEYLTDYSQDFLTEAAHKTYGEAFGGKAGYLAPVEGDTYALELWHGPTCAFKDYALQLMPKLLVEAKKNLGRTEKTLILVATSGDTGKAALDGYHDIPGVEIAVFYPTGGTSEIQRLQMATQEGANVAVYAVRGNFDDAQTGVKKVFGDTAIAAELAKRNIRLSSANSINWGRLVPQIVYYFAAYAQLLKAGRITFGDEVDFCVPTGNFGDILAGYYAKRMGLPVGKLVCASNENNVLTDFLTTGTYAAKREFFKTTSPSMDILVSSNLERLLYHVTGSDAEVAGLMKSLAETGSYTVRPETLAAIQENFSCGWSSEEEVAGEIRVRYEKDNYLCDTHTAVAFHVAAQKKREGVPMVVLSTASPFKFPRSVLEALGRTAPENDFEAMQQLEAATAHTAPASLAALRQKPERFNTVIDPAQIAEVALGYQE